MTAMQNKIVPIIYSVNNHYAPYLYISLQSLVKHAGEIWKYEIYILYTELEKRHIKRFESLYKKNVKITCVDISKNMEGINIKGSNYLTAETCYRLLLPELFPQYPRILYIDSDTLVLADPAELFESPLNGKIAGVMREAESKDLKEYYRLLGVEKAFNAGILLIDMALFREKKIGIQCLKLLVEDSKQPVRRLQYMDQDALNIVLRNQVCFLDSKWNFLYRYMENLDLLCAGYRETYLADSQVVKIVHYVSEIKPWQHPEFPMSDLFWKEARQTPYYEEILFRNLKGREKIESDLFKNHIFPFDRLPRDCRIALYGAGAVGRTLNAQNRVVSYVKIVLWVDQNYKNIEISDTVLDPEMLLSQQESYDYILIAIDDPVICSSVEKMLTKKGLPSKKIVWSKYSRN